LQSTLEKFAEDRFSILTEMRPAQSLYHCGHHAIAVIPPLSSYRRHHRV